MEIHEIVKFCRAGSRFQDRLAREIDFSFIYFIRSTVLYYSLELRLALSLFMLIFLSPGLPPQAIMYRFFLQTRSLQSPLMYLQPQSILYLGSHLRNLLPGVTLQSQLSSLANQLPFQHFLPCSSSDCLVCTTQYACCELVTMYLI